MKILIFPTLALFFSACYSNNNFFDSVRSKYGKENSSYSIEFKPSDLKKNKQETKNKKNLIIKK